MKDVAEWKTGEGVTTGRGCTKKPSVKTDKEGRQRRKTNGRDRTATRKRQETRRNTRKPGKKRHASGERRAILCS